MWDEEDHIRAWKVLECCEWGTKGYFYEYWEDSNVEKMRQVDARQILKGE